MAPLQEMLRKFQAWDRARAEQTEQQAQTEQQEVLAQGQDAFKHLVHQRRRQELEAQRRCGQWDPVTMARKEAPSPS